MIGRSKVKRKNFLRCFLKNWRYARIYGSSWREALRIALRRSWGDSDVEDHLIAAYAHKRKYGHEDP